jgi:hypothetical protein
MAQALELGPCAVYYGTAGAEADIGATVGGVKFTSTMDVADLLSDQTGTSPDDQVITGMGAEIEIPFAYVDIESFAKVVPGATLYTQATPYKKLLQVVPPVGTSLRSTAKSLILKKIVGGVASTDKNDWYTFPIAACVTNIELTFDASTQRRITARFRAFKNRTTGVLFIQGDSTTTP